MNIENELKRPFPREDIHWRGQQVYNGKALALAYIDARHVMDRLDKVVGYDNWQDEYIEYSGRIVCKLGIKMFNKIDNYPDGPPEFIANWIWKSDGAGDTDFEGAKGGISDAFKRAGVKWGIGRYLYDMPAVWVPCETRKKGEKEVFKKFTEDPWNYVTDNLMNEQQIQKLRNTVSDSRIQEDEKSMFLNWINSLHFFDQLTIQAGLKIDGLAKDITRVRQTKEAKIASLAITGRAK